MKGSKGILAGLAVGEESEDSVISIALFFPSFVPHIFYRKLLILVTSFLIILNGEYVNRQLFLPDKFGQHCSRETVTVVGSLRTPY